MRRIFLLAGLMGLSGCAADPSVRYVEATSPAAVADAAPKLIDSFYLQRNDVGIALHNSAADGKPPNWDLLVTDVRAEEPAHRIMILRDDNAWTRTNVSLAKIENSDLIDSAGISVEDHRAELIETVATAAKTLVPLMVGASPGEQENQSIPGCENIAMRACTLPQPSELGISHAAATRGDPSLRISWGAVPASALPTATFIAQLGTRHVHGLYYAACRGLEIRAVGEGPTNGYPQQAIFSWKGKIADPRWVEFVRFPRKGSIRMHSQCGVSISSEADPTQSTAALITTALTQAAAVKAAIETSH